MCIKAITTVLATLVINSSFALTLFHKGESFYFGNNKLNHYSCPKNVVPCMAQNAFNKKIDVVTSSLHGGANPAAILCKQLNGKASNLRNKKNDQVSVCVFPDKSIALSWDLFKTIKPKIKFQD